MSVLMEALEDINTNKRRREMEREWKDENHPYYDVVKDLLESLKREGFEVMWVEDGGEKYFSDHLHHILSVDVSVISVKKDGIDNDDILIVLGNLKSEIISDYTYNTRYELYESPLDVFAENFSKKWAEREEI